MRIAHGFFFWQEPRSVLEPCLRSTVPYVDELILSEGLIEGFPDLGLAQHGDVGWLAEPSDWLPAHIHISSHFNDAGQVPWPSIAACANWILGKAKQLEIDWLLNIDADEELHEAHDLRVRLEALPAGTVCIPLRRLEANGNQAPCPWKLVNVHRLDRYLNGHVVRLDSGETVDLVPPGPVELWPGPWLSHHPDRRPPWRRAGRLGDYENVTDPIIREGLQPLPLPAIFAVVSEAASESVDAAAPAWYCPGCGSRYQGPGICANGHEPLELLIDPEMAPAANTTDSAESEAAPEPSPDAATEDAEVAPGSNDGSEAEAPSASVPPAAAEAGADGEAEPPPDASPDEPAAAPAEGPAGQPPLLEKAKGLLAQAAELLAQL